jgi:hypothetical protein
MIVSALVATPYLDTYAIGEVETGRGGLGVSLAYYPRARIGFELDVEQHNHFFKDKDVAGLVPEGVDLDTDATLLMGNVAVPFLLQGKAGTWCPYGTAGVGVIRAVFDGFVFDGSAPQDHYDTRQVDLAFDVGGGVMHSLTRLVGLRVDGRYFHAFVGDTDVGGYFEDYDFLRVSVGITLGFPQSASSR